MTTHLHRVIRAGVTLAGMAALGATLSTGTALAAEQDNHFAPDEADASGDGHADGFLDGDSAPGLDADYLDFDLPTRGPSASMPVDDDSRSIPGFKGMGHHDHHGSDDPYDYDLYQPAEHYDANECGDDGDPGSERESEDDYGYEFDEGNATRDAG